MISLGLILLLGMALLGIVCLVIQFFALLCGKEWSI